jgi:phosphatidylglycerol:prolipoprotein diacylglycerol transferase
MLHYPDIDPVAFSLGPMAIHWYGLMYVFGIAGAWWVLSRRIRRRPDLNMSSTQLADITFYAVLGVILGGRLGYVLFYNFPAFLAEPTLILRIWQGGMSFHGGLLGVTAALGIYAWRHRRNLLDLTDFVAPVVPIGLGLGRIGNFINGELWGKPTDSVFGMVVDGVARHPSQLYQAFLEGVALFAVLYWYSSKPRARMSITGLFLLLYGIFRFMVEFVRLPDAHIGYLAWNWLTMGQVLSTPMILGGLLLLGLAWYNRPGPGRAATE